MNRNGPPVSLQLGEHSRYAMTANTASSVLLKLSLPCSQNHVGENKAKLH